VKDIFRVRRMWRPQGELKKRYDVVIIGGGSHGLATAYYLVKNHGVRNVAILERSYIGSGASGRNTTIIRSNYRTPEGAAFYGKSVELYEHLSGELDFNLMFSQHGHLTLAHTDSSLRVMQERAEVNDLLGIDSRVVYPREIGQMCPELDLSDKPTWPIMGALYHAPGGIIRHDAVVWGFARGADRGGVELHQGTDVTGIETTGGRVTAVQTNRGRVEAEVFVSATAGWSTLTCGLADVRLPITTHILQAFVTEPVKPILHKILVSANLHVYVSQTDRGEFLIGSEIEPYTTYNLRSTFTFVEHSVANALDLVPFLARLKILRQWTGYCDMTPDYSPIMGETGVENFYLDAGWGTWGFKATAVCGETMAEMAATRKTPELIADFRLSRFDDEQLVPEKAAASVSH
jgi:sarcosine oxidase, subunit beta